MLQPMQIITRHHSASAAWDICPTRAAAAASRTAPHAPLAAATPASYQYSQEPTTHAMHATADNHTQLSPLSLNTHNRRNIKIPEID